MYPTIAPPCSNRLVAAYGASVPDTAQQHTLRQYRTGSSSIHYVNTIYGVSAYAMSVSDRA
eukprot:123389-Rhodomonas_salina.2